MKHDITNIIKNKCKQINEINKKINLIFMTRVSKIQKIYINKIMK